MTVSRRAHRRIRAELSKLPAASLVRRASEGDTEAAVTLMLNLSDDLREASRGFNGIHDDPHRMGLQFEDAFGELMVRTLSDLPKLATVRHPFSWFLTGLRNIGRDHARRDLRHPVMYLDDMGAEPMVLCGVHSRDYEVSTAVHEALRELPASARRIISSYDLQGWDIRTVAAAEGVSVKAAHTRRSRARKLLSQDPRLQELIRPRCSDAVC